MELFGPAARGDVGKNDVMGFCKKGVMPLMFQEKMRMLLGAGGPGVVVLGSGSLVTGCEVDLLVFLLLVGGGLISRVMVLSEIGVS